MRRTQIYLDNAQAGRLSRLSAARGTTASKMIREAIDAYLTDDDDALQMARYRAALHRIASAPIERLPPGSDYVSDLRQRDRQRDEDLEERWRS